MPVPLTIRAVMGRGWGPGCQHSKSMHGILAHIPGIKCYLPVTPQDAYNMTELAIQEDSLTVILEHRWLYDIEGRVNTVGRPAEIKPEVVREGKDITVVAVSWMVVEALKAAEVMSRLHGIEIEVIDVRTTNPQYKVIQDSVRKTDACIVADYDWIKCGFGQHVAHMVTHTTMKPTFVVGFDATHCPTARHLEDEFYSNAIDIIGMVEHVLEIQPVDLSGEEFYSYENKFKGPF